MSNVLFKVVREKPHMLANIEAEEGVYYSLSFSGCIKYEIGAVSKARIGRLFCFNSLENAVKFRDLLRQDGIVILEVEPIGTIRWAHWIATVASSLSKFWSQFPNHKDTAGLAPSPVGTMVVPAVKPRRIAWTVTTG